MPKRYRGNVFAVVTWLSVALALALAVLTIWQLAALQTENSVTAKQYAHKDATDAEKEIAQTCSGLETVAMTECIGKIIDADQERERAESDLAAQWDAANWALVADAISAVGTVATIVGLWFVILNLREARKTTRAALRSVAVSRNAVSEATEANRLVSENAAVELRAWVAIDAKATMIKVFPAGPRGRYPRKTDELRIEYKITLRNLGKSVAKNIWFQQTVKFQPTAVQPDIQEFLDWNILTRSPSPYSIMPGDELVFDAHVACSISDVPWDQGVPYRQVTPSIVALVIYEFDSSGREGQTDRIFWIKMHRDTAESGILIENGVELTEDVLRTGATLSRAT